MIFNFDKNFSVIVNIGPGSFSGIRISLAVAKGIKITKGSKLYGYKDHDLGEFNLKNIEILIKNKLIENRKSNIYIQVCQCFKIKINKFVTV